MYKVTRLIGESFEELISEVVYDYGPDSAPDRLEESVRDYFSENDDLSPLEKNLISAALDEVEWQSLCDEAVQVVV